MGKIYPSHEIGYLWLNPIGCAACVAFSLAFQAVIGMKSSPVGQAIPSG
jgi:hypothetical protein